MFEFSSFPFQNVIKVDNIPVRENEDLLLLITALANEIDFTFNADLIDSIYRRRITKNNLPPSVFIKFMKHSEKTNFLIKAKINKSKLNTEFMGVVRSPIFINEYLSPINYGLLKQSRNFVKEGKLFRTWTRNGKVMVRKAENATPVYIQSSGDLLGLIKNEADFYEAESVGDETDTSIRSSTSITSKKRKIKSAKNLDAGSLKPFLRKKSTAIEAPK